MTCLKMRTYNGLHVYVHALGIDEDVPGLVACQSSLMIVTGTCPILRAPTMTTTSYDSEMIKRVILEKHTLILYSAV